MTVQFYTIVFLILMPYMSMSQEKDSSKITYQYITITDYSELPDPPFKEQISSFATIADWLDTICNSRKPEKEINTYIFCLFEGRDNNVLSLVGLNTYPYKDSYITKVDFKPTNMYLQLPVNEYSGLNQDNIKRKIYLQLKEFTNTEEFKQSFLSKSNLITAAFGGNIWSR